MHRNHSGWEHECRCKLPSCWISIEKPVVTTLTWYCERQPKKKIAGPSVSPASCRAALSYKNHQALAMSTNLLMLETHKTWENWEHKCNNGKSWENQTCRNPLNGAKPVPGPIITIGVIGFEGSLKFDCRTNTGAWLHSAYPTSSAGTAFCKMIPSWH